MQLGSYALQLHHGTFDALMLTLIAVSMQHLFSLQLWHVAYFRVASAQAPYCPEGSPINVVTSLAQKP